MLIDYECKTPECENFEETEERIVKCGEISAQTCKECGKLMKRIWNSNVSIKTSDGFKS